jgi:glycosyltransferase involved in cell wall biosynthesis
MRYRLGILSTHPIQYQVPWFRALAAEPDLAVRVFFCQIPDSARQGAGFGINFDWDIPLLDGYDHEVLENAATDPSLATFGGCDTPGIYARIKSEGFDAFLVNGWNVKSYFQAVAACWRLAVPCLVRGESNMLRPRPWWKGIGHRVLLRRFAACLAIGKSNAEFYLRHGFPQARLFPARYCVDNERFAAQAEEVMPHRNQIRQQWGIAADKIVFLFCGKFIEKKRPLDFLRALESVAKQGLPVHALLVGDGALKSACEEFARARCLPVTFSGFLNQMELPRAYAAADCLVLPSDYGETWGLVVNEAMACGVPCVVSDRAGCGPDLIVEGRTGRIFPFGDCGALASCLSGLAGDREGLRRMGQEARQHVAGYSIDAAVRGTLEAVRFVCADRIRPHACSASILSHE